jgi:hypothetical protein
VAYYRSTRYTGDATGLIIMRGIVEGDALALSFAASGARHAIIASSEEDVMIPDLGVPIRFLKGTTGDVTHLRIITVEGDLDAPRVRQTR